MAPKVEVPKTSPVKTAANVFFFSINVGAFNRANTQNREGSAIGGRASERASENRESVDRSRAPRWRKKFSTPLKEAEEGLTLCLSISLSLSRARSMRSGGVAARKSRQTLPTITHTTLSADESACNYVQRSLS